MTQAEVRQMEEETRQVRAVTLGQQGSWLHWEGARQRNISWGEIWNIEGNVLSSCTVALADGRYTWRHDQVLKEIAASLDSARKKKRALPMGQKLNNFVKVGAKGKSSVEGVWILTTAADWEMRADIHQRMGFPEEVLSTPLRPDILLWSRNSQQVFMVELTVPWDDRIE
ncbi:uncharacterized protein [Argopecten irradians]|uniref:uncharacterized protein n=1 Tax=Argopecten irradians TaxID=31199 RepID=UPI00371588D9